MPLCRHVQTSISATEKKDILPDLTLADGRVGKAGKKIGGENEAEAAKAKLEEGSGRISFFFCLCDLTMYPSNGEIRNSRGQFEEEKSW